MCHLCDTPVPLSCRSLVAFKQGSHVFCHLLHDFIFTLGRKAFPSVRPTVFSLFWKSLILRGLFFIRSSTSRNTRRCPGKFCLKLILSLSLSSERERERGGRREESKIAQIMDFTIAARSWNYGNHSYLICIKYCINFIEIGPVWIFFFLEGGFCLHNNWWKELKIWKSPLLSM